MKKKRFIKLLMAEGISRNQARIYAAWVAWDNIQTCKFNHYIKAKGYTNTKFRYLSLQEAYDDIKISLSVFT